MLCPAEETKKRTPLTRRGSQASRRTYVRMKECSKCGRVWPLSEFQFRSVGRGTYRTICRECRRIYNRAYYRSNCEKYKEHRRRNQPRYRNQRRQLLLDYVQGKSCVDCGETDPVVFEFDHVHGDKEHDIGAMISMYAWPRILAELQKCVIRCANCHRRKTARDFKWFRADYGA